MPRKVVNLGNFASELEEFSDNHVEDLKDATFKGIVNSVPGLIKASPVDTGQYASSWDFFETELGIVLGNFAPHAAIIEKGARPFTSTARATFGLGKAGFKRPIAAPSILTGSAKAG